MGAGTWPAGSIIAGGDVFTSSPAVPPRTAAAQYSPTGRVVVVNADGSVAVVHYVDQQVSLALGVPLGSIKAAPTIGIDLETIRKATKLTLQRCVTDAVSRALGSLLALRSITLGTITSTWRPGASLWSVNYTNLVLPSPQSRVARSGA